MSHPEIFVFAPPEAKAVWLPKSQAH